jgi:GH25 family lysozyme M1 (1,4-beta-N-acetylmuramidase)
MTLFGWDASDFDWARGPMDVAAAVRDGIVFFTHKATEGTTVRHQHLGDALGRARAAGLEFIGAYHVVRTGNVDAQVAYYLTYLDQAAPWWRDFPGFFHQIDLETWSYDQVAADTGIAFARALLAAQPKAVLTYASRGEYSDSLSADPTPLWNANYGTNPAMHYREAYPGDSSPRWTPYSGHTPVLLQYGSQLTIGSQPDCDANAFRGTLDELRALIENGATMDTVIAWNTGWMLQRYFEDADPIVVPPDASIGAPGFSIPNIPRQKREALAAALTVVGVDAKAAASLPATVNMTDADRAAIVAGVLAGVDTATLATQIATAVIAHHDALTDADQPEIETAVRTVLHGA